MPTVFLGIGSNVGDRRGNVERALAALRAHPAITVMATSPWREYPALTATPDEVQSPYINGVGQLTTTLTPELLLAICQRIEQQLGRRRESEQRWAPRPIDLDILFYDDLVITTLALTIPHPELTKRLFVLEPLAMLAPDLIHPIEKERVGVLLARLNTSTA